MSYYFSKTISTNFDDAIERITKSLGKNGFGVLTTIDLKATLKNKIDVDFRPYTILGACSPKFAYRALELEDKIGTMLPCNVIVQQLSDGQIEIAAVDPAASMQAVANKGLQEISSEVQALLKDAVQKA